MFDAALKIGKVMGLKALGATKTALVGGAMSRMALGGIVGAGYSAVTNNYNDTEMALGRIVRGAFLGAAVGGLSRLVTPAWSKGKFSGTPLAFKALWSGTKRFPGLAASSIKYASKGVGFAMKNPTTTLGIIGGGYLLNEINKTPYGSSIANSSINRAFVDNPDTGINNAILRENTMVGQMNNGVSPMGEIGSGTQIRNQRMLQSTVGLTQSLHSRRHG